MPRRLDEELARAAGLDGDHAGDEAAVPATADEPAPPPLPRPAPKRQRNLGILAALLVMVGGVVALFLFGFKEAAIYATPVDKLVASRESFTGRKVRVDGELVPGTLAKRDQPCEYRFTIHGTTAQLPVRYAQCVIPDTFRDVPQGGVQVTVEGALTADGSFDASLVMAKCTSHYDPKTHQMKDESGAPPAID